MVADGKQAMVAVCSLKNSENAFIDIAKSVAFLTRLYYTAFYKLSINLTNETTAHIKTGGIDYDLQRSRLSPFLSQILYYSNDYAVNEVVSTISKCRSC